MSLVDELTARLAVAPDDAARAALVSAFWDGPAAVAPIVEEIADAPRSRRVTFVRQDADAHAVLVFVNRITESVDDAAMQRVPGTGIWHRSFVLESDWRGAYTMMSVDRKALDDLRGLEPRWAMRTVRERGEADERNPMTIVTHGGAASMAELADATPQPWLAAEPVRRGRTSEHRLASGRRVWVHRPADDDGSAGRPVVVVLDGEVWQRSGYAARTIDALAEADAIRAPYLLLVDAEGPRRMTDLSIDGTMSTEIVDVVLPWARGLLPISDDPSDVIVSGESLGGLTALKTAFDHPHAVGAALAQSSSLWQHDMLDRAGRSAPVRLFLTAGRHEGHLVEANRVLADALGASAHDHHYVEYNGGHDMAWWRGLWGDGIRHLLAPER